MEKNMFEILKETLQNDMEIINNRELSNKYKFCIVYKGMQAATELPKITSPGSEIEVCRKAINNAVSTMYINVGELEMAKKWLHGDMWKKQEKYNDSIMEAVRQRMGLEEDDDSQDEKIMSMDKYKVFREYCLWYGLSGNWYSDLLDTVENIYGIELTD